MTPQDPSIAFDERGLAPAVVQDAASGEVLMLAWMNAEALRLTQETGEAHFWSRSRGELWRKGATSGNVMRVLEVRADCDADTLLLQVQPAGPACHTGARSCFFRRLQGSQTLSRGDYEPAGPVCSSPVRGSEVCGSPVRGSGAATEKPPLRGNYEPAAPVCSSSAEGLGVHRQGRGSGAATEEAPYLDRKRRDLRRGNYLVLPTRACYALCTMNLMNRCAMSIAKATKCSPTSVSAKRS
jgi:phosphoribosyl-AMP cyclohydrolase